MSSTSNNREQEIEQQKEMQVQDEIQRLKDLETQNNNMQKNLRDQMAKNQQNEQIFLRTSAFLEEINKAAARITYMTTMIKDIIDNRNLTATSATARPS